MSHLIPPLVSNSPPPIITGGPDDLDDEFGDFAVPGDINYDGYSLPSSPMHLPNFNVDSSIPDLHNGSISPIDRISTVEVPKVQKTVSECVNNSEINISKNVTTTSEICEINDSTKDINCENLIKTNKSIDNQTDVDVIPKPDDNEENNAISISNTEIGNDFGDFQNCFQDTRTTNKIADEEITTDGPSEKLEESSTDFEINEKISEKNEPSDFGDFEDFTTKDTKEFEDFEEHKKEETITTILKSSEFGDFENHKETTENVTKTDKLSDFGDFEDHKKEEIADFGDFEDYNKQPDLECSKDEDFGDFNTHDDAENYKNIMKCDEKVCDLSQVPDSDIPDLDLKYEEPEDDLDFGDFESSVHSKSITKDDLNFEKTEPVEFETDFTQKDDDFGDFNDYSTQSTSVNLTYSKTELLEYSEKTIKNIFKMDEIDFPEFIQEDFTENNPVFNKLKIIENTHALNFQWNNSEGQKMLLKSLNIDSRNILYGPRWNPSMPKFASNLGFQPLEPQKTVPSTSTQNETQPVEVPDAKFDWTSSGLVNPLDCSQDDMLLDLEQLVTSLDLAPTTSSSFLTATTTLAPPPIPAVNSPVDDYQTWDHWLQCQSNKEENTDDKFKLPISDILSLNTETTLPQSDNESVNSLKFVPADNDIENQNEDDFTNFESYKTDEISWSPINMQPLRETHISEQNDTYPNVTERKDDDDFADFQMSLPEKSTVLKPIETVLKPFETVSKTIEPVLKPIETVLKPLETGLKPIETGLKPLETVLNPIKPSNPIKPEQSFEQPIKVEETVKSPIKKFETILEPLKPIVLQPTVLPTAPTKIEWPEPGIVDEVRISEFDLNYTNKNTVEDDDWSDFVSVTKPQENIQSKNSDFGNFSQLSVPNLQNTQLNCKSLPQMQPATSSPIHKPNSTPSTQQIAVQQLQCGYQPPYQIPLQQPHINAIGIEGTEFEPSLKPISTNNLENFITSPKKNPPQPIQSASLFQPIQSIENSFLKMQQSTLPSTNDDDDDYWCDFVSNQTVATEVSNGWNTGIQKPQVRTITGNVKPCTFSGWSQDVQPNIITNPVHFDVFQSYQPTKDTKMNKKQNNVPTISSNAILPELDFSSPKSKFFIKK